VSWQDSNNVRAQTISFGHLFQINPADRSTCPATTPLAERQHIFHIAGTAIALQWTRLHLLHARMARIVMAYGVLRVAQRCANYGSKKYVRASRGRPNTMDVG
jgi:hypothetical protein